MTLLHGDAHIGNTYVLPDGGVGFLDWQVVRRGEWSQDVGYFLVGCLTEEDRRRNEGALLDEYRCSLTIPNESRPTPDELWLRYRASAAYGLAIWLSTLGSTGFQSREISMTLTQRYAAAFDELETEKAFRELLDLRFRSRHCAPAAFGRRCCESQGTLSASHSSASLRCAERNCRGATPVAARKAAEKFDAALKPRREAISFSGKSESAK